MHTYTHKYIHKYRHTDIHIHAYAHICTSMHAYMHTHTCIHVCRKRPDFSSTCVHVNIHTYIHICSDIYTYIYAETSLHMCMYIHTYACGQFVKNQSLVHIFTCAYACIHTYKHGLWKRLWEMFMCAHLHAYIHTIHTYRVC